MLEQGDWPDYSKATVDPRGLPAHRRPRLGLGPERAPAPGRLPDRRLRVRHHGADVQRRRRQHRRLRGAVAAQHALGLPRPHARRRGRRLAADLRGPRALLRARGARLRRLRPGRRHGVPARRGPAAAAGAARARRAGAWPRPTTSWAGTGGPPRWRSPRASTARSTRASSAAPACRAAPTAPRAPPTARTGRARSSSASSCARARACASSRHAAGRARRRRDLRRRATASSTVKAPASRSSCANGDRHAAAAAPLRRTARRLANSSGLVGKRLMMHPFGTVVGVFDEDFRAWQGPWGQYIHSLEFYETDASRGFVRGAKWGLQPTGGPFSMTRAYPWGAENAIWGEGFQDAVRGRLGHSTMWGIIAEDLPEESNRVVLDPIGTDEYGIPGAKIEYRCRRTRAGWWSSTRRARRSRCWRRARVTVVAPFIRATGWHLLGTALMGTDPATLGRRRAGPRATTSQPLRLRRQRLADVGGHEPDRDDRGARAALHRPVDRVPPRAARGGMSLRPRSAPSSRRSPTSLSRPAAACRRRPRPTCTAASWTRSSPHAPTSPRRCEPRSRTSAGSPRAPRSPRCATTDGWGVLDRGRPGRLLPEPGDARGARLPGARARARSTPTPRPTTTTTGCWSR